MAALRPGTSIPRSGRSPLPGSRRERKGSGRDGIGPEERLVAALIAQMESGTTPWRRDWDAGGGHHVNLLSGRRYRGANPILLSLGLHRRQAQRPFRSAWSALPCWCGFAEARSLGITPRRGSQAVHVLRPQVLRRGAADPPAPADVRESAPEGDSAAAAGWIRHPSMPLFHVADLVGQGLEELIERRRFCAGLGCRPEPERLAGAEAVLRAWPVPVRHGGERACYRPQPDRIELPPRAAFHSAAALYATWAHEAIHSTGHPARLARDLSGNAHAREELVAELGAVLLGDRLEIGSDVCNHAAYLSHWIELLRESPRQLFQVLNEAWRAADLIAPEPLADPEPWEESEMREDPDQPQGCDPPCAVGALEPYSTLRQSAAR